MIKKLTIPTVLLMTLMSSAVYAQCDITDLSCWGSGKKCNIKFRNETGEASGSGGGSYLNQKSQVATIKVSARKADGTRAGSNTLKILAGDAKTMNLDKKKDFVRIKVQNTTNFSGATQVVNLDCQGVRQVLQGNGVCKVFWGCIRGGNIVLQPSIALVAML